MEEKNVNKTQENTHIFRYHPFIIIKGLFKFFILFLVFFRRDLDKFIRNGFDPDKIDLDGSMILIVGCIFLFLAILSAINGFIKYKKSYIEINANSLVYKKNTMFGKKSKESQLEQVSNLHFSESILDKLLRCTTVQLDINSSATASEADYNMFLSLQDAKTFKTLFDKYKKARGKMDDGSQKDKNFSEDLKLVPEEFDTVYTYTHYDTIKHVFLDAGIGIILFLSGTLILGLTNILENFSILAFVLFIGTMLWDFFKKFSNYYNYTVKSNETHILWNYGLFTEESFSIEKNKITSIELNQEFFARILGYYEVNIKVVGIGNSSNEIKNIALYSKKDKAFEILNKILPENEISKNFEREDLRVGITRTLFYTILSSFPLLIPFIRQYYFIYLPIITLILLGIFVSSRGSGFDYKNGKITLRKSIASSTIYQIERNRIEHIVIKENKLYNMWNLSNLEFHYKDNVGFASMKTGFIQRKLLEELVEYIKK